MTRRCRFKDTVPTGIALVRDAAAESEPHTARRNDYPTLALFGAAGIDVGNTAVR